MSSRVAGICLIEPWLRDYVGHSFNYARSIYVGTRERHLRFKVLASSDCSPEVRQHLPVDRQFHPMPEMAPRGIGKLFKRIERYWWFSKDLNSINSELTNDEWVLFVENAFYSHLLAWAMWLRRLPPRDAPTLVIMFRFSCLNSGKTKWRSWLSTIPYAFRALETTARTHRVRLVSDSEIVAREVRDCIDLPVIVLPIPHTRQPPQRQQAATPSTSSATFNVLFPGRPMLIKGVGTLTACIKQFVKQEKLSGMSFTLQDYRAHFREPDVQSCIATLRQMNQANIHIVDEALAAEEYYLMMSEADVVVLPYICEHYRASTSGPFVEALAMGKPVIVTEGTWMSTQLKRFGGGVTFKDQDPDDLERAICEVRDNYRRFADKAKTDQAPWVSLHNPQNFVDELLMIAGVQRY